MWRIQQIFDGEYGCEERQPGEKQKCIVRLVKENGDSGELPVFEDWLRENGLEEGAVWDKEIFDVCDCNGQPTGRLVERSYAHTEGICHRAAHIWIVRKINGKYQVLLQKRSENKDSFPGQFDTSSAGHIQAGDEPLESALRELSEELGIQADASQLFFAGTFPMKFDKEFHGKMFRDREVAFVYCYKEPVDTESLVIQKEELDSVEWFDLAEVYEACKTHNAGFCVPMGGLETLMKYLGDA